jgi:predicted transcriptional regulator
MATQEMILKLSFDDEGTFTGLEDINQELAKTDTATKAVEKSTKTLKAQYAELKKQQDQFDPGTKKFQELSVQMGELKDRMNDAADAVKGNTGPAIEGARASFGLMGEQIANLDFEGLSQSLNLVSGNLARLKPEDISKGLKSMADAGVNAFKAIGKAILANPLLAIGAVIVGIAMNFDKIIKFFPEFENALTGIDEKQREVAKNAHSQFEASKKAYENALLQENSLRLQGKSEKEILQYKMGELEASIKKGKIDLQIQEQNAQGQIDASKRNAELLTQVVRGALELSAVGLRMLSAPIDLVLATANKVSETLGFGKITAINLNDEITKLTEAGSKMVSEFLIDPVAQEKELKESLDKQRHEIAQMESDYIGFQLSIKKIDSDAQKEKDKLAEDALKKAQDELEAAKKLYQERRDAEIAAEDAKYKAMQALQESALEKEITTAIEASEELYKLAGEDAAAEAMIAENLAKQIADIQKKYADEEKEAREKRNEANAILAAKELEDAKKLEQEKAALRMANIQSNFEMAGLALDALSSLNEAAAKGDEASQRKVFERNKNIQKAQATIAMASGIVQQLAVPQDQLTGMNFVKAAALAAAGIANIVKINQTQFNGSVPSPNGGNLNAPSGMGNAPAIDFSGANMMNNAPGTVETYVLAGNVANALEARQKIIDQSYL